MALEPATGAFLGLLFQLHFVGLEAVSGRSYIEGRGYGAGNRCFSWFAISATFCRIRGSFRKNLHCILIIQQWKRLLLSDSFGFGMSSLVIFRCHFGELFLLSKSSRLLDVDYANSSKL